jgi:hypothetical protein
MERPSIGVGPSALDSSSPDPASADHGLPIWLCQTFLYLRLALHQFAGFNSFAEAKPISMTTFAQISSLLLRYLPDEGEQILDSSYVGKYTA